MSNLILDKVSKATFKCNKVGDHLYLKGVNIEGIFQVPYTLEGEFEKVSGSKNYKSNGKWPSRLAELLIMASKKRKSANTGTVITIRLDNVTWRDNAKVDMEESSKPKKPRKSTKQVKEETKPKREIKFKPGVITLTDICDQLGIKPASARGKLRGQIEKPKEGWKWTSEKEVQKIIKILQ